MVFSLPHSSSMARVAPNITPSVEFAFRGFNASEAGIFYRLKNQVTTSINFIDNLMSAFSQILLSLE